MFIALGVDSQGSGRREKDKYKKTKTGDWLLNHDQTLMNLFLKY